MRKNNKVVSSAVTDKISLFGRNDIFFLSHRAKREPCLSCRTNVRHLIPYWDTLQRFFLSFVRRNHIFLFDLVRRGIVSAVFLFFGTASRAICENQFQSFGIQQAGKLLSNPPQFIYEFQRNMESTNPLPPGKRFGFNYHFLGGIIIVPLPDVTSAYNFSGKLRLHPEGRLAPGLPQLDVVGGHWDSLLTSYIEDKNSKETDTDTKVKDASLNGSYGGVVMTSSLEPRVRLFWGYKYSKLDINIKLNKAETVMGTRVDSFKGNLVEHTVSAGVEHTYGKDKRWIMEGGYGVTNNLLTAKVSWYRKYVEFGLNIYPESVFVMQPQLNFHYNF